MRRLLPLLGGDIRRHRQLKGVNLSRFAEHRTHDLRQQSLVEPKNSIPLVNVANRRKDVGVFVEPGGFIWGSDVCHDDVVRVRDGRAEELAEGRQRHHRDGIPQEMIVRFHDVALVTRGPLQKLKRGPEQTFLDEPPTDVGQQAPVESSDPLDAEDAGRSRADPLRGIGLNLAAEHKQRRQQHVGRRHSSECGDDWDNVAVHPLCCAHLIHASVGWQVHRVGGHRRHHVGSEAGGHAADDALLEKSTHVAQHPLLLDTCSLTTCLEACANDI
eukprot:CAMPEP_0176430488 /NCGR_PEP_ID=MMETSP0127-20121128/14280_1 /TAXON_ID=938130 /ORGANISM="Platyophrya macrostoma, Strain WH" /LENGTH=271 /DNA_ID=CAMNT_0017812381 /DNA_START=177 /DNA_END=992 /DNA_ORIENTATION=-